MTGKDGNKDGPAAGPKNEPKIRRKQIKVPKPIMVPDSCKLTVDGGLDSPWMKLDRDMGLDLTAPRTPEHENGQRAPKPTDQLKENAPAAEPKAASAKKKASLSKQKRAAPSPSTGTFTPKKPRKSKAKKNVTPSNHTGGDISYWSSSRRHSDTLTQHPFDDSSDLEDDHRPERASKDESGAEEAYLYGAGDDDAEDEYATFYDGDDQGAKMRRY